MKPIRAFFTVSRSDHHQVLTGIRGWAALWVFLYHAWTLSTPRLITVDLAGWTLDLTPLFSCGWAGVQIFFVLSGFLLALPFASWQAGLRDKPKLPSYLRRRLFRVFPAYYTQLLLLLLLMVWQSGNFPLTGPDLIKHLFMFFTPPPLASHPLNPVWWTLPIELSFYLFLPALAFLLKPARWFWLLLTGISAMLIWRMLVTLLLTPAGDTASVTLSYFLPGSMDSFSLGMLGALFTIHRDKFSLYKRIANNRGWLTLASLLLILILLYWMHADYRQYWRHNLIFYLWTPMFSIAITLLLINGMAGCRIIQALFANRVMVFIGTISYSLYLWHMPIMEHLLASPIISNHSGYILPRLLVPALGLTLFCAFVSYILIERTFIHLARKPKT